MINAQVDDLSSHNTKYTSLSLTQKVFANIRRIGKGFSGVDTPLYDAMLVQQQIQDDVAKAEEDEDNEVSAAPTPPSPTPATTPPPPQQEPIPSPPQAQSAQQSSPPQQQPSQHADISESSMTRVRKFEKKRRSKHSGLKRLRKVGTSQRVESSNDTFVDDQKDASKQGGIAELDADEDLTLVDVDVEVEMDANDTYEAEPAEVEEVLEVVTAAKLMTEVVTAAAPITTAAQDKAFARQLEAELNANIEWKDVIEQVKRSKRQNNEVMIYQALKRKPLTEAQARKNMMIYLKNMARFKMNFFKGMTYSEIRPPFEKHYNLNQAFLERVEKEVTVQEKEIEEEGNKRKATPLASMVPVVDYQIRHENNKPYFKIIRAEPKNFLDDFLLNILKIMFEKANVEANVWKE
uniref:Uncharacterized protein n=1 Tax=Tanacetum cinerariifolium TaxID=118510 RepID=A0A699HWV7_TANCI|nr:hypothetical protein [Tanacetum cinerariifolium]